MMRKMIILGISVVLCCSALAFFLLYYVLPQYYFSSFWMLPVYFSVLLLLEILLMNIFKEKSAKTMNVFLITKIVKFLLSVCLIVLYLNVVAENNIEYSINEIRQVAIETIKNSHLKATLEKTPLGDKILSIDCFLNLFLVALFCESCIRNVRFFRNNEEKWVKK